ncbi:mitochondrial proton/calcium exchanger protein-like protein isoform X1, partial [Tanacetum coccineum]
TLALNYLYMYEKTSLISLSGFMRRSSRLIDTRCLCRDFELRSKVKHRSQEGERQVPSEEVLDLTSTEDETSFRKCSDDNLRTKCRDIEMIVGSKAQTNVEDGDDLKECGEDKANTILGVVLDKLEGAWFNVITEYLVNISKRRAFWSLNEDILKITILTINMPYSSRMIRCIRACTHQRPQRKEDQYAEVILFYNGLGIPTRQILDSRGAIPLKIIADAKKTLEEVYYTQFGGPFKGGGYRAAAPGFYQRNNVNPSYQEQTQSIKDTLSKFMSESAKRHEENSNLIKEIRASIDATIRNQRASIKTLEIQIGQMSKVLQERGFGSLPRSTKANPRDQVKSISTTIEVDSCPIRRIRSSQYAVSTRQNGTLMYETRQMTIPFPSHLNGYYCKEKKGSYGPQFSEAYSEASQSIPRKEKDLGSFTLPCFINNVCFDNALVELGASVSVMPLSTYLNLGLYELAHTKLTVELADRTVNYPKGIAKNVLTIFVYRPC